MTSTTTLELFHCINIPPGNHTDVFDRQAIRMVLLHNIVIRGMNSMLYYSGQIQPDTTSYGSFLAYCTEVIHNLHKHHIFEEEHYFPFLENHLGEGSMTGNINEHDAFKLPLTAFETLLNDLRAGTIEWDVEKFRKAIYAFSHLLKEHLAEEIDTIRSDVLKPKISREALDAFELETKKSFAKNSSLVKDPQMMFINGDAVNGAWFPPIPRPIIFVIKTALWYPHSDWWQFGSCDKHMQVKPEFAAYEPTKE